MSAFKLAIVGSRHFRNSQFFHQAILDWIDRFKTTPDQIISGGAKGADQLARDYARKNHIPLKEFLPDWSRYGKAAGPIRNNQIVKEATHILAFLSRHGSGTQDTIRKGKKAGKIITTYYLD